MVSQVVAEELADALIERLPDPANLNAAQYAARSREALRAILTDRYGERDFSFLRVRWALLRGLTAKARRAYLATTLKSGLDGDPSFD